MYRLARELELGGWVRNDARGVELEIEGAPPGLRSFRHRLLAEAPPMARVERVSAAPRAAGGERDFRIAPSAREGPAEALVVADAATCAACLAELSDPADRRYRYPFINCTDCGPRFTIVRGTPYDRPLTTMAGFQMCPACRAEYEDPARPALPRRAQRLPGVRPAGASEQPRRRPLGRGRSRTRCVAPRGCSWTARSSPSRASAAITSPATPRIRPPWRGCARASIARSGRSR